MRISVIGAGAIGCLLAGYLKIKGEDVSLVGRNDTLKAISSSGLCISGSRGNFNVAIPISDKLNSKPELVVLATKIPDVETALKDNLNFIRGAKVLTIQNGVAAESLAAEYIAPADIISGIVIFGATYLEPGKVLHNFEGGLVLGSFFGFKPSAETVKISEVLDQAFPTIISEEIKGMKYVKIFANLNNCLPAILGLSMQEIFKDLEISRVSLAIWKECFEIARRAGIKLVSLPGFSIENVIRLLSLPKDEAVKIFSNMMCSLSKEPLYGSILQSIKRKKITEVDYLNGEFVRLAQVNNMPAPINKILVELVHQVEKSGKFFSKEELFKNLEGVI